MRAVVMKANVLSVEDWPDPVPQVGQTLVRTIACGICGSDLHFLRHGPKMAELSALANKRDQRPPLDFSRGIVMGHEFAAEVLEHGPGTEGPKPGRAVVSMAILVAGATPGAYGSPEFTPIGYSNDASGGFAERMVLSSMLLLEVPNGLDPRHGALTEPMAVGAHAVAKAHMERGESAVVHGCGPVGLSVIAALRLAGVETVVAGDFSSARRALAQRLGATEVVDPAQEPTMDAWYRVDGASSLVQFECIGVPGILDLTMQEAPRNSRIVVVGACMERDHVHPMFGIGKELNLQFVLGYTPGEFAATLRNIAEGHLDVAPLLTGSVDLHGVPQAFGDLADPEEHVKILVQPN